MIYRNKKLHNIFCYIHFLLIFLSLSSCKHTNGTYYCPELPTPLDSIQTEVQLDNILNGGYIRLPGKDIYEIPLFQERSDLRYLPYLYLMFNQTFIPDAIARTFEIEFQSMCLHAQGDTTVYKIGDISAKRVSYIKQYIAGARRKAQIEGLPDIFWVEIGSRQNKKEKIDGNMSNIDSLRVRVVAYNDRNALKLLEKYYTSAKKTKELAIYYKVMLAYEGNGDLAEKYYKTLKQYVPNHPELLTSIREVLLRAAHCDNDRRAQELCDSLGFSLCDYRLPVPCESE